MDLFPNFVHFLIKISPAAWSASPGFFLWRGVLIIGVGAIGFNEANVKTKLIDGQSILKEYLCS